jgi:hypothetical protein
VHGYNNSSRRRLRKAVIKTEIKAMATLPGDAKRSSTRLVRRVWAIFQGADMVQFNPNTSGTELCAKRQAPTAAMGGRLPGLEAVPTPAPASVVSRNCGQRMGPPPAPPPTEEEPPSTPPGGARRTTPAAEGNGSTARLSLNAEHAMRETARSGNLTDRQEQGLDTEAGGPFRIIGSRQARRNRCS